MQAIASIIDDCPGCECKRKWFIQLRTPHDDVMQQIVLATLICGDKDEGLERAMKNAGVTEIVPWSGFNRRASPTGVRRCPPGPGLLPALRRCEEAMAALEAAVIMRGRRVGAKKVR